ncbi:MAG: hypothetical protein MSH25_01505, partial [Desulfovibrio sp.]|uniref:hypothetical protein n=1 Tax=Desulfovibrio sp. TaxID=885 RepID=UPI0025C730F6
MGACAQYFSEHFQFETCCVSNPAACRFAEKTRFFRSLFGRAALGRQEILDTHILMKEAYRKPCHFLELFQTIRPVISQKKRGFSGSLRAGR